jgi:hypothetical protein
MAAAWLCLAPAAAVGQGQEPLTASQQTLVAEGWTRPPEPIARAVLAPRHENVSLSSPSPDMRYFLREESQGLPSMPSFAREHKWLGGLHIDQRARRLRTFSTRPAAGQTLHDSHT